MRTPVRITMAALAAVVLSAGCGGSASSSAPPPVDAGRVDWAARTVDLDLPAGWAVEFCEGEGPFLCIERDSRHVGVVELLDFHRAALDGFDGDLTAHARDIYETLAADRHQGCGAGYRFEPDEPAPVTVAGREGIRYSFTGYAAEGRPAERGLGYAVLTGDVLFTVAANAYEPDGCVSTEGGEFTVAALGDFEATLAKLAAASALPRTGGAGTATGYLLDIRPSGSVRLDAARILSGQEAVDAARDAGVIGPDEELETDFFVLDTDDTTIELRLTDRTHVELLDCSAGCELVTVPVDDFLSGSARPHGGKGAIFSITLSAGEVVSVVEHYLP